MLPVRKRNYLKWSSAELNSLQDFCWKLLLAVEMKRRRRRKRKGNLKRCQLVTSGMNAVCTPAVYLWGSPALREATVRTVWGRVCPRCRRRLGSCHRKDQSKGDGNNKNRRSPFSKWF
uniref:uncharacterized protein LOC124058576 isoform X3 n=1 Tax=Scatophagus argus TaxID=75038 RepID=UPI001ED853F9|nr:uncharacterized protein LOC124058576 isoform X3 [Scatophagus argus]